MGRLVLMRKNPLFQGMISLVHQAEENPELARIARHRIQAVCNRLRKRPRVNINSIRKVVKCPIQGIRTRGNSKFKDLQPALGWQMDQHLLANKNRQKGSRSVDNLSQV